MSTRTHIKIISYVLFLVRHITHAALYSQSVLLYFISVKVTASCLCLFTSMPLLICCDHASSERSDSGISHQPIFTFYIFFPSYIYFHYLSLNAFHELADCCMHSSHGWSPRTGNYRAGEACIHIFHIKFWFSSVGNGPPLNGPLSEWDFGSWVNSASNFLAQHIICYSQPGLGLGFFFSWGRVTILTWPANPTW